MEFLRWHGYSLEDIMWIYGMCSLHTCAYLTFWSSPVCLALGGSDVVSRLAPGGGLLCGDPGASTSLIIDTRWLLTGLSVPGQEFVSFICLLGQESPEKLESAEASDWCFLIEVWLEQEKTPPLALRSRLGSDSLLHAKNTMFSLHGRSQD